MSKVASYASSKTYEAWDDEFTRIAKTNKEIYAVHAAASWMIPTFTKSIPERCIDVGIAEQNLVSVAAGMAHMGKNVFAHTLATFATMRACEQVRDDIIYNENFAKVVASYAGLIAGPWAATHFGIEDVAITRTFPGMTVISPADTYEVKKLVPLAIDFEGPMYIRLEADEPIHDNDNFDFQIGKSITVREGDDLTLIAYGAMVGRSIKAAEILSKKGIEAQVINMHTIKPLDEAAIIKAKRETGLIITVEEHQVVGGLGGAVAEFLSENDPYHVKRIGFQDVLPVLGSYEDLLKYYKLDPNGIADQILDIYNQTFT